MEGIILTSDKQSEQWIQTFSDLYRNNILTDVTLVCNDRVKISAHKIVLCAGSTLFRDFFVANNHSHPLLFLKGVNQDQLVPLLQFLYYGEVKIPHEKLHDLLNIAQDLEVLGLRDESFAGNDYQKNSDQKGYFEETKATDKKKEFSKPDNNDDFMDKIEKRNSFFPCTLCDFKGISFHSLSRHLALLHAKDNDSVTKYDHLKKSDFEGSYAKLLNENSESVHNSNDELMESYGNAIQSSKEPYDCLFCEFKGVSFQSLEKHTSIIHKNQEKGQQQIEVFGQSMYECDQCKFKGISEESLKLHNEFLHKKGPKSNEEDVCEPPKPKNELKVEPMKLECSSCGFVFEDNVEAGKHIISIHDDPDIKMICSLCSHSCKIQSLQNHYYTLHSNRKFQCDQCYYITGRKDEFQVHKFKKHGGKAKYECQICDFKTMRSGNLRKHHDDKHLS